MPHPNCVSSPSQFSILAASIGEYTPIRQAFQGNSLDSHLLPCYQSSTVHQLRFCSRNGLSPLVKTDP